MSSTSANTENEIQTCSRPAMPQQLPGQAVDISGMYVYIICMTLYFATCVYIILRYQT